MLQIFRIKNYYLIKFKREKTSKEEFNRKLEAIKALRGRQYWEVQKAWAIPVHNYHSVDAIERAIENHLQNIPETNQLPLHNIPPVQPLPDLKVPVNLKMKLYPFQEKGVAYNIVHGSALNGDQQGLGKTAETIASIVAMNLFPCLIICKKTLMLNWEKEWRDWTEKQIMVFKSGHKESWTFFFKTQMADVGIVNYDSLKRFFVQSINKPADEEFKSKHIKLRESVQMFKSIVIDESHYVKDRKTMRTKLCVALTRHLRDRGVFLLSGTPILNDPIDLYTQLTMLNRHQLFGRMSEFEATFSGKHNRNNLKYLNAMLHQHCYFRRTKVEVKTDLPAKTRQIILCDITNWDEYMEAEKRFKDDLHEQLASSNGFINKEIRGNALQRIAELKKITAKGKLAAVKEWIDDLMDVNEKLVVFSFHKEIQQEITKMHSSGVRLGDLPIDQKEANKWRFQEDPDCLLISCSISADSEGHTLNAASNLLMVELPWTFGKKEQCEDRIHRITNTLPANITDMIADKTIDRYIYDIIMDKKEMHDSVTGAPEEAGEVKVIDRLISLFNQK